jgi:hypothetical protein
VVVSYTKIMMRSAKRLRDIPLFFFSHRLLALARWDLHFMRLRLRNFLTRKHAAIRKRAASARPMYLNLGSGPRGIDDLHWINVDGYPDKNVDFLLDFARHCHFPISRLMACFANTSSSISPKTTASG